MVSTIADVIEVRSPWDGRALGSVPAGGERQIDEAVAVALDRHRGPQLPAHDSGNTREGPFYAAQEMTEQRLVVLSP